ncbi:hypothetical protein QVM86_16600 [Providencia stuartii]|nr:hypothetical protein [Providencia stuartii]
MMAANIFDFLPTHDVKNPMLDWLNAIAASANEKSTFYSLITIEYTFDDI